MYVINFTIVLAAENQEHSSCPSRAPSSQTKLKSPPCTPLHVANVGRISWSRFHCCCLVLLYCLVYSIYLSGTTNSIADFEQLASLGPDPDAIHSQGFIFQRVAEQAVACKRTSASKASEGPPSQPKQVIDSRHMHPQGTVCDT